VKIGPAFSNQIRGRWFARSVVDNEHGRWGLVSHAGEEAREEEPDGTPVFEDRQEDDGRE
jgi:hypothetical protein